MVVWLLVEGVYMCVIERGRSELVFCSSNYLACMLMRKY